jgi:mRNA-degrading endonuclease RelE of RelBE toxin-antitoxin system
MSSAEKKKWAVVITGPARKSLKRIPSNDQVRVRTAIDEMEIDPFQGDVKYISGQSTIRRRVGNWRIFFNLEHVERLVVVTAVERRTSTTY